MRCVAIIMVHNGLPYVDRCLQHLFAQGIEVAILDHGSTDGTYEHCQEKLGVGVCHLARVPYDGSFSLSEQLRLKQALLMTLATDWVIHQDIDECLEPPVPYRTLLELMAQADEQGFNVLNFDEFVFIPHDVAAGQRCYDSRYYYFFQPFTPRLMRAWKKTDAMNNLETGGHVLTGDVRLFPQTSHLRHYLFTDQQHAYQKYAERQFASAELAKGWHKHRVSIPPSKLVFPDKNQLECLPDAHSKQFCTAHPWKKHYWQL